MSNGESEEASPSEDDFVPLDEAPNDEQLLSHLQFLLVWLRTLEVRSLELLALPDLVAFFGNEGSAPSSTVEAPAEDEENGIRSAITSLGWTLNNTVQEAFETRQLLLQVREETDRQNTEIHESLRAVRSRLFGISQQLGVSFVDDPQPDGIDDLEFARWVEFARRVAGKWFIPHFREHVLSFDRARCDLTVAMIEDDERQSIVDENSALNSSTDDLDKGFHPYGTSPPEGWHGPLSGNMTELSRWVLHRQSDSQGQRPIQRALQNQTGQLWGRIMEGNTREIYFANEERFKECDERRKTESNENDS